MNSPNPQRDLDATIERTLRSLGMVEPTSGFHERLTAGLNGLNQRSTSLTEKRPAICLALRTLLGPRVALILAWIAAALGFLLLHTHQPPPQGPRQQQTAQHGDLRPSDEQDTPTQDAALSTAQESSRRPRAMSLQPRQDRLVPNTVTLAHPDGGTLFQLTLSTSASPSAVDVPTQAALDLQAADDLHAPSQPAPQEPSTGQERLVRLMLRQGEKHDLAQLEAAERTAFAQQQAREFNSFFNPPAAKLEIGLANRVYAPQAITLDEVREIDAAQHNAPARSSPTPTASAGDLK